MSGKSRSSRKVLYGGQWVKVRNLMNSYFQAARPCASCRTAKCELVWYNITTHEVQCTRCFTPPEPGTDGPLRILQRRRTR